MTLELTLNGSIQYSDADGSTASLDAAEAQASVAAKKFIRDKVSVATSEQAINLGNVTALGWACFVNRDPTNYVDIRVGTGSTKMIRLPAAGTTGGYPVVFYFGPDVTAPYIIANTAACYVDYLIVSQ